MESSIGSSGEAHGWLETQAEKYATEELPKESGEHAASPLTSQAKAKLRAEAFAGVQVVLQADVAARAALASLAGGSFAAHFRAAATAARCP